MTSLGRSLSFKRMPKLCRSASFDRRRAPRANANEAKAIDDHKDDEAAEVIESDEELEDCCEEDEFDFASGAPLWLVWAETALAEAALAPPVAGVGPLTVCERELATLREELAALRHLQAQRLAEQQQPNQVARAGLLVEAGDEDEDEDEDDYDDDDFEEEEDDDDDALDPVAGCPRWLVVAEALLVLADPSTPIYSGRDALAGLTQASTELGRTREEVAALRQSLGVAPPDLTQAAATDHTSREVATRIRSSSFRRKPQISRSGSFTRRGARVATKDQSAIKLGNDGEGKENQTGVSTARIESAVAA